MEYFKEMNAGRCLRCDGSKWDDETYPLAEYRPLLVLLDDLYHTVLMAQFGFTEDIREIRVFIKDVSDSVNSTTHLELTEPLKLHVFVVHVVEFAEKMPRNNELQRRVAMSLIACFRNTFKLSRHFETLAQPMDFHGQNCVKIEI